MAILNPNSNTNRDLVNENIAWQIELIQSKLGI